MTREIGMRGEELVAEMLLARGYKILARNYRTVGGEIDIIARRERTVHFVEVKTRTRGDDYGRPAEAVTREKQRRILRAARYYMMRHKEAESFSFDVAEVEVHLLEDAF